MEEETIIIDLGNAGDKIQRLISEAYAEGKKDGAAEEREACAALVDSWPLDSEPFGSREFGSRVFEAVDALAVRIRARSA